jgi:MoxR-like ATPase
VQFTPDLVPSDLIGTRIWRPDTAQFDTELGPVFGNFLLADEINRAPAKVQSALLEVMQERQVTIAGTTYPLPRPFLVMATQNPIESEGTYALPEAQIDRFLFKLVVTYPSLGDEAAVIGRAVGPPAQVHEVLSTLDLDRHRKVAQAVFVDREVIGYAARLADATRHPERYGSRTSRRWSATARARAGRSASCRPARRSRCCAAARTSSARTCATSRPTSCATASR